MIYQITYVKDESGQNRKVARLVKDRQELLALRDSPDNLGHLAKAKQGDKAEKDYTTCDYFFHCSFSFQIRQAFCCCRGAS